MATALRAEDESLVFRLGIFFFSCKNILGQKQAGEG